MAENTTTSTRTGTVRATYTGATTKTVTITQSARSIQNGDLIIYNTSDDFTVVTPYYSSAAPLGWSQIPSPESYTIIKVKQDLTYHYNGTTIKSWVIQGNNHKPNDLKMFNVEGTASLTTGITFHKAAEIEFRVGYLDNHGIQNYLYFAVDPTFY